MLVSLKAWSERHNGCTEYCVAVVNDQADLYEIFEGRARSDQVAYERALARAQEFINQKGYQLEEV
jgi:hypothetical protein